MSAIESRPIAHRPFAAAPPTQPVLGARRPKGRLAAAGLLLVLFALGNVALYSRVAARPEVLAVARDVAYGQVLAPEDLKVVQLRGGGVSTIPAARMSQVVGQTVRATLGSGTLLSPSLMLPGPAVGPGDAVASAALRSGLYPAGLRPGDRVRVVSRGGTGTAVGAIPSTAEPIATGTVLSIESTPDAVGVTAISLIVASEVADEVSAAAAEGRISLVLVGAS